MKITANIATQESRLDLLSNTIDSIYDQFDEIRIYFNSMFPNEIPFSIGTRDKVICFAEGIDLADNGKFRFIPEENEDDEYYFTLDDDIIYPSNYVSEILEKIKLYRGSIISYHGRELIKKDCPYYTSHKTFNCFTGHVGDKPIDVPGTGVTGFDTRYFKPTLLYASPYKKMSDLVFAKEAAEKGVPIICIGISGGILVHLKSKTSIARHFSKIKKTPEQDKLANEIFDLRHG